MVATLAASALRSALPRAGQLHGRSSGRFFAALPALPQRRALRQKAPRAQYQQQGGGLYPPIYQSPQDGKLDPVQASSCLLPASPPTACLLVKEDMLRVGTALRNIGWMSFWGQLALTTVSTVILLFSSGSNAAAAGTGALPFSFIDVATLVGVLCGYISTFLAWSYTTTGRKLGMLQEVRMTSISGKILANSYLNLIGMGATIIALQATVGSLVAKTLQTASAGAFYSAQRAGTPPVALDVFSVQACTNTIMAHFVGMIFSTWLLGVLDKFAKKQADREAAAAAEFAPSAPPMPPGTIMGGY
ncbi:TIC chloroplastic isoform A [Micractinium conductrix]|uniref:TIC chloroplastic isoform A n=1 Tax=Micractinium conductrix TaxID=554055 RepID=A0A2P6V4I9_9CHLO|nr:TIC chloroplastic isoform A [Micractinium conductrix]|eukprot:PSC69013.1 TIC chloroplastic isoform A [Micractinium conductrix]